MVLRKCCFCFEHRSGAIVIAILQIIGALAGFVDDSVLPKWHLVINCCTGLICGIYLIYGAIKYNTVAILVSLIFTVIVLCFLILGSILSFMATDFYSQKNLRHQYLYFGIALGVALMILALLEIYFWLCIFSFYGELKSESRDILT